MSKKNSKQSSFISSIFPTVTEYENTFVKEWNKNTADAVAEVLKYMAQATASAIRENKTK